MKILSKIKLYKHKDIVDEWDGEPIFEGDEYLGSEYFTLQDLFYQVRFKLKNYINKLVS